MRYLATLLAVLALACTGGNDFIPDAQGGDYYCTVETVEERCLDVDGTVECAFVPVCTLCTPVDDEGKCDGRVCYFDPEEECP